MDEHRSAERRRRISATDAAFAGFTLVRERPTLFFGLMALIVLLGVVSSLLQVLIAGPALTRILEMQAASAGAGARPDPQAVMALMGPIWRMNLILFPLTGLFYATVNAAVYRAMLRPAQSGFGYLRFGVDELRQLGVLILLFLTMIGVTVVAEIGAAILVVIGAVVVTLLAHGGRLEPGVVGIGIAVAVIFLVFVPIAVAAVRLSLAGPMTFGQRRVRVTGSWALTRGRFWPIFGAYLLAAFIMALCGVVLLVASCIVAFIVGGIAGVRGLFIPDSSSLAAFFTPGRIIMMVLNAPLGALWIGIQAAVPAALYAQIAGGPDPDFVQPDRSHTFGTPSAPNPPQGEFPITTRRDPPPPDEL